MEEVMKLKTRAMALAIGIGAAGSWTLCSLILALAPGPTMSLTGSMFHLGGINVVWGITWGSFFLGLVSWTVLSGLFAALSAWLYNRLIEA
jgi:hypothetical protein